MKPLTVTDLHYVYNLIQDESEGYAQMRTRLFRYAHDYSYTLANLERHCLRAFAMLHGRYPVGAEDHEWNTDAVTYGMYNYLKDLDVDVDANLANIEVEVRERKPTNVDAVTAMANFAKDPDNKAAYDMKVAAKSRKDIIAQLQAGTDVEEVFEPFLKV